LDVLSRVVVQPGKPAYKKIVSAFGKEILLPNGELDRKKLGSIVFQDEVQRKKLNSITHPSILRELLKQAIYNFLCGGTLVIIGLPLLHLPFLNWFERFTAVVREQNFGQVCFCSGCSLG
jgi:dephospho-CoA kinase